MNPRNPHLLDDCIDSAAAVGLSREQKSRICQLARRAWDRAGRPFLDAAAWADREPTALSPTEAFDLWRQQAQEIACGRRHLTAATQADYPLLMAHITALAGSPPPAADRWRRRAAGDPRRQARAKLDQEIQRARDTGAIDNPETYVLAIATRQFKAGDLRDCNERQLWSLVFTLRNRISARLGTRRPRRSP